MSTSRKNDDSEYIQAVEDNQPTGTTDIANELGVVRQTAEYRLKKLEEEGEISSQMIGGSLVWTV